MLAENGRAAGGEDTAGAVDLSLIVACYNEASHLEDSFRQVIELLDDLRWSFEIIFVDDCSTDRTKDVIVSLLDKYKGRNVRAVFHERNMGRGRTVSDGFRLAKGNIVGFIDIDLEVSPVYIPACVSSIRQGADIVVGERHYKLHFGLMIRHVLSRGYVWLTRSLYGITLGDTESGYKFFRREKAIALVEEVEDGGWFWDTEMMIRAYFKGYTVRQIPCLFVRRYDKKSTVRVVHDSIDYLVKLWRFRSTVKRLRRESNA